MASLPPSEIAYQQAHIEDNLSTTLIVVCTIFVGLALLSLCLRLVARRLSRVALGWDDYLAIAASIPLTGLNVTACLAAHWGIGRVVLWAAKDPQNPVRIGKTELAFSVFYDCSMLLGKLSILALLARVFTLHQKWFKIGVFFWATWTILWWTSGVFVIFLECRPLSTNWGVPYQCRPTYRTSVSVAVFNTIADFGILILPQPMIWQLQLPHVKKLALSVVFLMGFFAAAVSIARIPLLKGATSITNYDPTYTSFLPVTFTVLEPASVLMCACWPMFPSIFRRVSNMKITSYLNRSSQKSTPSSKKILSEPHSEPDSRPSRWTKLEEGEAFSQAKYEGQIADNPFDGTDEFELEMGTMNPRALREGYSVGD